MIAVGCRYDPPALRVLAVQGVQVGETTADLEGAGRRMVLVLHDDVDAGAHAQQWPGVLRRRRDVPAYDRQGGFDLGEREHLRHSPIIGDAGASCRAPTDREAPPSLQPTVKRRQRVELLSCNFRRFLSSYRLVIARVARSLGRLPSV